MLKNKNRGKKLFKSAKVIVSLIALFLMPNLAFAVTQQDLNQKNQELENAKNTLNQIAGERKTLQSEVANYDRQIGSIQNSIYSSDREISRLAGDISTTEVKITEAEAQLKTAYDQLSEIVRVMYEEGQISNIELIAKSKNFSEFIDRSEYIETIQLKIKDVADKVVAIKSDLESKKKTLEDSKKKTEELKNQQLAQRSQVASQRTARDMLLQKTKGDEAAYQDLVKKIKEDYNRLQAQMWANNGNYVSLGHVEAGDIIGYIGNSGYSTGCHLHFEIRNAGYQALNPASYIGDGYFIHPVPGVWVSAPYGYSSAYFSGVFHTGIDYADGCKGTPIRATAEGEIIQRVSGRPNTFDWSLEYGNFVKIRHSNGMYSLYGHMR